MSGRDFKVHIAGVQTRGGADNAGIRVTLDFEYPEDDPAAAMDAAWIIQAWRAGRPVDVSLSTFNPQLSLFDRRAADFEIEVTEARLAGGMEAPEGLPPSPEAEMVTA